MQLFAVACRAGGAEDEEALAEVVRGAASDFPRLAGGPLESGRSGSGRLAYAALAHPDELATPRRYRARRGELLALYDGFPVDRDARFDARDAGVLLERWDVLPDSLEGVFAALRVDLAADRVDCLLDILGMLKVFVWRGEGRWVLSNSAGAIARLTGASAPDPLGVSALLSLGWPVGRSLLREVEQLEGGRLYSFGPGETASRTTFSAEAVAPANNPGRIHSAAELAERMERTLAGAVAGMPEVSCPVTAGRDTRVLFALSLALGRPIDYYTSGVPGEPDVDIARDVTARMGVGHETLTPAIPASVGEWVEITSRFVQQTDGLATMHGIGDHLDHAGKLRHVALKLWGPGGEIARAGNIGMLIPFAAFVPGIRRSWEAQRRVLWTKTDSTGGTVRPEAVEATRDYLDGFVDARRAEGWRSREVLEAYYGFERVRHWGSVGVRRMSEATDVFAPFVCRDFYEYAFALEPGERYMEAAHYRLLSALRVELRDMPFEKDWKPQRAGLAPLLAARGAADAALARVRPGRGPQSKPAYDFGNDWFEAGIPAHRELIASVPSSPLWEFVDRPRLTERLAGPPEERRHDAESLAALMTAFWYFHGPGSVVS
jgi:asparagine synthase (glutamine-hydrolysing)